MNIAVMTDTNSGITQEEAKKEGIFLLPMPIDIDDKCYLEGIDLQAEQLYEALEKGCHISTSQPSPVVSKPPVFFIINFLINLDFSEVCKQKEQ